MLRQRVKCFFVAMLFLAMNLAAYGGSEAQTIRFAMTPALLLDQQTLLADWRSYLESRSKRSIEFVQRDHYRETMDLLQQHKVDFAWICDYPYVALKKDVRLLAVAINNGWPTYRAYLIVPARDKHTHHIRDLKGTVFAYSDQYSNTGYLSPRFEIKRDGGDPATFFKRTFFTWSHRKTIDAVAAGLAQGASVDSFVWDALSKVRPDITVRTRIAWQSESFGFPPIVAQRNVSQADFDLMQRVLFNMRYDLKGRELLGRFNLEGFVRGEPRLYDGVAEMMQLFGEF